MVRRAATFILALALSGAAVTAAAQEGDIWPEHAISDDEAARLGRQAMPLTQEQIETLGLLLQQVREATAAGDLAAPEGHHRRAQVDPALSRDMPRLALARGYTSAVSFTDVTGRPWPIEEVLVDEAFLPAGAGGRPDGARHLLYLAPASSHRHGNAVVKLVDLAMPVVLTLVDGEGEVDLTLDLRIPRPGPLADPAALVTLPPFQAGDDALLDLLAGIAPDGATRLVAAGAPGGDRAWSAGEDVLLVTRATILSPGPWAAERSADGRWAYRLPATPFALLTLAGREFRVDFRAQPTTGLEAALP